MPRLHVYPLTLVGGGLLVSASACGSANEDSPGIPQLGGSPSWMIGGAPSGGVRGLTGGTVASGGMATGGDRAAGGATASGGVLQTGGATATGGAVATGGTTGGTTATGGAVATGGATATGGALATGGSGGAASSGTCPATPPTDGEPCNNPPCFYDACPSGNRTLATCNNNVWSVEEGTSCAVQCSGFPSAMSCPAGTFCRVSQGGAIFAQCDQNTCGTGPVTAACTPNCAVTYSLEAGVTVTCNTCPQGGCP